MMVRDDDHLLRPCLAYPLPPLATAWFRRIVDSSAEVVVRRIVRVSENVSEDRHRRLPPADWMSRLAPGYQHPPTLKLQHRRPQRTLLEEDFEHGRNCST